MDDQNEGDKHGLGIESLGDSDGDHVEVVRGLSPGDRVVIRANFLIDSESRLKASLAAMSPERKAPDHAGVGTPSASQGAQAPAPESTVGGTATGRD